MNERTPFELNAGEPRSVESSQREAYVRFQDVVSGAERILREGNPARWWQRLYKYVASQRRAIEAMPPDGADSIARQLDEVLDVLRAQVRPDAEVRQTSYQAAAQNAIHDIADALHRPNLERERSPIHVVSYEQIAAGSTDVRFERRDGRGYVSVRKHADGPWVEYPIPVTELTLMKGGLPRILLKRLFHAPTSITEAEFPINDIDVIADGEDRERSRTEAMNLGADADGIEWTHQISDLPSLLRNRDIDLNQCFLSKDGLVYTERAAESAVSGSIVALASDRGIYGNEDLFYKGIRLVKNRAESRLVKFVTEGKATSFELMPINRQVPLGIYWLVLSRKFMFKKNGPELLDRMFEIGKQIGQVRDGETLYDTLERVHAETPFFSFSEGPLDEAGVTRWLGYKLSKLSERTFRMENRMSIGLHLERAEGDTVPQRVSLDAYVPDPARIESIRAGWQAFVERCDARAEQTAATNRLAA